MKERRFGIGIEMKKPYLNGISGTSGLLDSATFFELSDLSSVEGFRGLIGGMVGFGNGAGEEVGFFASASDGFF